VAVRWSRGWSGSWSFSFFERGFLVGFGLCITSEEEGAFVGAQVVDIEHLDGGELVENGPGGQSGGVGAQAGAKVYMDAIGQEGDKDVGFDPGVELMVDRPEVEIVLEGAERGFHFRELDVEVPGVGGLASGMLARSR